MSIGLDPLLDGLPCGFAAVGDDGMIQLANTTLAAMLAMRRDALVGRHVDAVLTVPSRIFYQTHIFPTVKLQGQAHELYLAMRDAHGAEVPVLVNAQRRARDGRFMSEWVVVPMRQRHEYENAILQARRTAEEASRSRDEFVALVSHELRSPLSAILGWAHLLAQGRLEPAALERAARAIEENARAQAKLVDDLLDFGRIASGKLALDVAPTRVDAVLSAAIEGLLPAIRAKRIALEAEIAHEGVAVSGDADRLRQVFWNILANAVKFTPIGGRIVVVLRRSAGQVEARFTDSGKGIAADFVPHLFERFRQEDAASRREGGLGLGMAITRHLVELHGGTIAAASDGPGLGATFTVRIPALPADACPALPVPGSIASRERRPAEAPSIAGLDLLVVDDDATMCEWVRALLMAAGAQVRIASSAQEGFRAYQAQHPDVLVSDIEMQAGDGLALVRRVRELEEASGARTPAIALTGRARDTDRLQTLSAGFQVHLAKPVDPAELLAAIANLGGFAAQSRQAVA